jgi:hypothetical protein
VLLNHEERTIHTSHLSEHGFLFTFQASFFLGPQFYVPYISLPLKSMHGHQLQILVGSLFSNIKQFKKKAPHEGSRPKSRAAATRLRCNRGSSHKQPAQSHSAAVSNCDSISCCRIGLNHPTSLRWSLA